MPRTHSGLSRLLSECALRNGICNCRWAVPVVPLPLFQFSCLHFCDLRPTLCISGLMSNSFFLWKLLDFFFYKDYAKLHRPFNYKELLPGILTFWGASAVWITLQFKEWLSNGRPLDTVTLRRGECFETGVVLHYSFSYFSLLPRPFPVHIPPCTRGKMGDSPETRQPLFKPSPQTWKYWLQKYIISHKSM